MTLENLFTINTNLTDERKIVYQGPVHMLAKKEGYQLCESNGKPMVGGYWDGTHWLYHDSNFQTVYQGNLEFAIPAVLELLSQL